MISLREKLSEFSYGYGVTREAEDHFASVDLRAVPFFPSLLDEGKLGFDVAFRFDRPGYFLVLQFKLGEERQRFRRTFRGQRVPAPLDRPYWQFRVDLEGAQFRHLKRAEDSGADVFFVAPRFSDWLDYREAYFAKNVLNRSLLARPSEIHREARGAPAHRHRVIYDKTHLHVCSDPVELEPVQWVEVVEQIASKVRDPHAESLLTQTQRFLNLESPEPLEELRSAIEQLKELSSPVALDDPNAQNAQRMLLAHWLDQRLLETQVLCITAAEPT